MCSVPIDPAGFGFGSPIPETALLEDYETRFGEPLIDTGFGHTLEGSWGVDFYSITPPLLAPPPGFGNVYNAPNEWLPVTMRVLPDDGGFLLELWGSWTEDAYRVRFRANPGGSLYPQDQDWAYSAVPGAPYDIVPNTPREFLRVVLPPMPTGSYDILLYWGATWGTVYAATGDDGNGAVDVVTRGRQQAVYRLRSAYPPLWKTGPRSSMDEELL